jgi:hypothetical protein
MRPKNRPACSTDHVGLSAHNSVKTQFDNRKCAAAGNTFWKREREEKAVLTLSPIPLQGFITAFLYPPTQCRGSETGTDQSFHFDADTNPALHESDANLRPLVYTTDPPGSILSLHASKVSLHGHP